jgi:uncharacterized protein (DUF1697 family)
VRYVALLRAINVGTANRVKMADLLAVLNAFGIEGATTYLQSGNVLFDWQGSASEARVAIEMALGDMGLKSAAIIRNMDEMAEIAAREPFRNRLEPEKLQFVTFFGEPFQGEAQPGEASEILLQSPTEIYWAATPSAGKAPTGPKLPKEVIAQSTNRNWIVTCALARLLKEDSRSKA